MEVFKEFYTCPNCGRAIEKRRFFICPNCGRVLCREEDLLEFDNKFCGNCGSEITSAKKEALALAFKSEY